MKRFAITALKRIALVCVYCVVLCAFACTLTLGYGTVKLIMSIFLSP